MRKGRAATNRLTAVVIVGEIRDDPVKPAAKLVFTGGRFGRRPHPCEGLLDDFLSDVGVQYEHLRVLQGWMRQIADQGFEPRAVVILHPNTTLWPCRESGWHVLQPTPGRATSSPTLPIPTARRFAWQESFM